MHLGEEALLFYNDRIARQSLLEMMRRQMHRVDPFSPVLYHMELVRLLSLCTEGKNASTELHCHSLLTLDDIVAVVQSGDCVPEVGS